MKAEITGSYDDYIMIMVTIVMLIVFCLYLLGTFMPQYFKFW